MRSLLVFKLTALALIGLQEECWALQSCHGDQATRRSWLSKTAALFCFGEAATLSLSPAPATAAQDLVYEVSDSGIQWADSKVGTGPTKTVGEVTAIDYVMSTTGARYGSKIFSTVDKNAPYRWTMGDGTTIKGLEEAIVGGGGIPPMKAGGIRRLVIPSSLAYSTLAKPVSGRSVDQECQTGTGIGPIPPASEAFEEFQRFKNIYCNPNRQYQPDLVIDIKLYGKRN